MYSQLGYCLHSKPYPDWDGAIACYEQALRFHTPEAAPLDYATTQTNLGTAYAQLPVGDRAANLRKAIACFEQALRFRTPEAAPFDYATTQTSLGAAYAELPVGDRRPTCSSAIACYEQALRFRTPEAAPFDYATTQTNLGAAYARLPVGDRGQPAEGHRLLRGGPDRLRPRDRPLRLRHDSEQPGRSLHRIAGGGPRGQPAAHHRLLRAGPPLPHPRGRPLRLRHDPDEPGRRLRPVAGGGPRGQPAAHHRLLRGGPDRLRPRDRPLRLRHNSEQPGRSLHRIAGGGPRGQPAAPIACFEQALRFRTPEAAPFDYATTQTSLGAAYAQLPVGDRAANLRKAIACYEQALRFRTPEAAPFDYVTTQTSLGAAYTELPVGDRAANLQRTIACFEQALRFRTPEAAPFDYATTQTSLGAAYAQLPVGDRAANLQRTIACFEQALRFRTPEAAPDLCRHTAYGLGNLHFSECQWSQAKASYTWAIEAIDALYKVAATEVSRKAELAKAGDLFSNLAFCLAHLGKFNEAVEQLEADKARGLAEVLARDRAALDGVKAEDRAAFEAVRSRIKSLEVEARAMGPMGGPDRTTLRSFIEISDDLRVARHDLDAVINRIRTYQPEFMAPGFDFEAIAATAMPECPLVYLITTSQGSLAFIVPPGAKTLDTDHVVWLEEFRSGDLDGLLVQRNAAGEAIGGYLVGQVQGEYPQLQAGLDRALPILRDQLVGPMAARLVELGFRRATLVPGGLLSLLPLHAAAFDEVTFTYAPSARALRAARGAARDRAKLAPVLLGIGNPLPSPRPLAFARTEVEEIAPQFAPAARHVLFERYATHAAVAASLPGATHLHFSCQGMFDVREPLNSALSLSGDDTLTLRDLLDGGLDFSAARLAVLSACQTGIVEFHKVPDEAIGFPAGFIQAGVPAL